jgi:hypothetical protein
MSERERLTDAISAVTEQANRELANTVRKLRAELKAEKELSGRLRKQWRGEHRKRQEVESILEDSVRALDAIEADPRVAELQTELSACQYRAEQNYKRATTAEEKLRGATKRLEEIGERQRLHNHHSRMYTPELSLDELAPSDLISIRCDELRAVRDVSPPPRSPEHIDYHPGMMTAALTAANRVSILGYDLHALIVRAATAESLGRETRERLETMERLRDGLHERLAKIRDIVG